MITETEGPGPLVAERPTVPRRLRLKGELGIGLLAFLPPKRRSGRRPWVARFIRSEGYIPTRGADYAREFQATPNVENGARGGTNRSPPKSWLSAARGKGSVSVTRNERLRQRSKRLPFRLLFNLIPLHTLVELRFEVRLAWLRLTRRGVDPRYASSKDLLVNVGCGPRGLD